MLFAFTKATKNYNLYTEVGGINKLYLPKDDNPPYKYLKFPEPKGSNEEIR